MTQRRWTGRPEKSNWGEFGPDDQIGRLNLITPERRRAAANEVKEGLAFCLSLPLDVPKTVINPRRHPPELRFVMRSENEPGANYPYDRNFKGMTDVVNDDKVTLYTQYSTHWDALCHIGALYDAHGTCDTEATFYNGFHAKAHVRGPVDYLNNDQPLPPPYGAQKLGIETMAETGIQGRGVMIDLYRHVGLERTGVGYDVLMRILEQDNVTVETGDILCFRTGYDRALLNQAENPDAPFDPKACSGLDGFDDKLLQWLDDCGAAALVSDNEAVELMPDMTREGHDGTRIPLHRQCLFHLGMPLAEMFLLSDLADWLYTNKRSRFLFTAPPLRLTGACGSPVTGVGTV